MPDLFHACEVVLGRAQYSLYPGEAWDLRDEKEQPKAVAWLYAQVTAVIEEAHCASR